MQPQDKAKELVFLKEVNDFQNELYNFKMKSKEIQTNIQRDIDSMNQNIAFSLLDEARLKNERSIDDLKTALAILKLELEAARSVIAKMSKRSEYTNMSRGTAKLPQFFLNMQLECLNKSLFSKILQIKSAKAQLKEHLDCEKRLRMKVSQALAISHNMNPADPPVLPTNYKPAPTPASSLSELISEMNGMINQLSVVSFKSSTMKVPTSKPAPSFTDKPMPTAFEPKPASIQSETIEAKTKQPNDNPMSNLFGIKPSTANNLGGFGFSNPTIFPQPPKFASIFESPLSKPAHTSSEKQEKRPTFEFKPPSFCSSENSKPKTTDPPINPMANLIGIKPTIADNLGSSATASEGIQLFEFKCYENPLNPLKKKSASIIEPPFFFDPIPKMFEFMPASVCETSKLKVTDVENQPMTNLFEAHKPMANLFKANKPIDNLFEVNKPKANLFEANKPMANLVEPNKPTANLFEANKPMANLFEVNKPMANLFEINKPTANFGEANKPVANLFEVNKPRANLGEANKLMDNPFEVNKPKANLFEVNKPKTNLFEVNPMAANKTQFNLAAPSPSTSFNSKPATPSTTSTFPKTKWPPFEFKPPNTPSETSKSKTSDPLNNPMVNLFGTIPMAANKSSPFNSSAPIQGLQPPSKPSFDFKPANIKGVTNNTKRTNKPKSFDPSNNPTNLFGIKKSAANNSCPLNSSAPTQASQSSAPFKFEYPDPKPTPIFAKTSLPTFKFKPTNINSSTKKQPNASNQVNNPMTNLFGTNPRVADNSSPNSVSGTTHVNFRPLDVQYSDITERHQCITCMNEYNNKSLEELRLEDYRNKSLATRTSSVFFFASTPFQQQTCKENLGTPSATTRVKFVPFIGPEVYFSESTDVKFQCIAFMKEYEGKSLEEIRLEDYMAGRRGPGIRRIRRMLQPYLASTKGTTSVKWDPPVGSDFIVQAGVAKLINIRYQCISCMKKYKHKSLEELRHEDYRKGLIPGLFRSQQQQSNDAASTTRIATESTQAPVFENSTQKSRASDSESSSQGCNTSNYFVSYFLNSSNRQTQAPVETSTQSSPASDHEASQQCNTPAQKSQAPVDTSTQTSPASDREAPQQCNTPTPKSQVPVNTSTQSSPAPDREAPQQCNTPTPNFQVPVDTSTQSSPAPDREAPQQCNTPTPKSQVPVDTSTQSSPTSDREASQQCNTPAQKSQVPVLETSTQRSQTSECEASAQGSNSTRATQILAEEKKGDGDRLCEQEKYEEAVEMFTEAIKLYSENSIYYTSRAAALMKLRKHRKALEDMQKAVAIDPMSTSSYISIAKCCLILGNIVTGEQAVRRATELSGADCVMCERDAFADLRRRQETALKLMNQNNFYDALTCVNFCLTYYSPSCSKTKLMKAECLAMLKRFQEAQDIAINISLFESSDADSFYVLGLCSFYQDKEEQAIKHFKKVLDLARDHKKAQAMHKRAKQIRNDKQLKRKREQGNEAFNKGNWQEALDLYNEALKIDQNNREENAKLHYNKATVYAKQNEIMKSAQACTEALELDGNYVKALLRRAQCYTELEDHEEAVEDYEKLRKINPSKENKRLLDEANKALKKYKKSNFYYKILGIGKTASEDDIKKAYRTCARLYHPDRHRDAGNAVIRVMERKFKQVGEANAVLSDPQKRAQYDRYQYDDDDDNDYRHNRYYSRSGDYYDYEEDEDDDYAGYY